MAMAQKRPGDNDAHSGDNRSGERRCKGTGGASRPISETRLGSLVSQALQFSEMRHSKIDRIRQSLANRLYRLDAIATAQAMLTEQYDIGRRPRVPLTRFLTECRRGYRLSPESVIYGKSLETASSRLLSRLAQDLNKQIGIIMAHTELMNLDPQLDSIHRMHLQVIRREATRLQTVVGERLQRSLTGIRGAGEH